VGVQELGRVLLRRTRHTPFSDLHRDCAWLLESFLNERMPFGAGEFLRIVLPVRPLVAVNDGVGGVKCLMFAAY